LARYYEEDQVFFEKKFSFKNQFKMRLELNEFTQNGYYFSFPHNGLVSLMLASQKNVFVDVGSNVGIFSIIGSQVFKNVHSFEPVKENYLNLQNNIKINNTKNIKAYNCALGSKSEYGQIVLNKFNSGGSKVKKNKKIDENSIKIINLDKLNIKNVSLIKIDVEGSELDVLKGSKNTIRFFSPTLFVEVSSKLTNIKKISSFLGKDYMIFSAVKYKNKIPNDMIFVHKKFKSNLEKFNFFSFNI
jgi:FkbM family methyltransferase